MLQPRLALALTSREVATLISGRGQQYNYSKFPFHSNIINNKYHLKTVAQINAINRQRHCDLIK